MRSEMNVDGMSRLMIGGMSVSTQSSDCSTYRVSFEEFKNSTEFACHVRFHEFSNMWLVLNVYREGIVLQQLRFDC